MIYYWQSSYLINIINVFGAIRKRFSNSDAHKYKLKYLALKSEHNK